MLEQKEQVLPLMISDQSLREKWIEFHNQKCQLRVIDKQTHRNISKF